VVTSTVAVAPLEATGVAATASVIGHFVGEGPVDVATEEPHPAVTDTNIQTTTELISWVRSPRSCIYVLTQY
jgi:hypothetical protein